MRFPIIRDDWPQGSLQSVASAGTTSLIDSLV